MTAQEFDILDELYFVTSFTELTASLNLKEEDLIQNLKTLLDKGYVKSYFPNPDAEHLLVAEKFEEEVRKCYFLASKAGLLAHNIR
ncbi:MAG: hypothetical protein LPK19_01580 [Hymenobacteraceae bacterium]|nr:hypothetical protein [Hymenobacteraceae bacterium]MDX5394864.1 hypothetical protein [Hymenobacteraceae bacterium]MDX5510899.1 hypothetical protein [Hymenobacteraceae bacterium]